MGQVNTVSPGVQGTQSVRGSANNIPLIAQSNNPTAAGNTDLGQGVVQGFGPDRKTVYVAKLVMRIYDGLGKTRYYANGKALPAHITDESAARTFARQQIAKGALGELPLGDQNAFSQAAKTALTPNVQPGPAPQVEIASSTSVETQKTFAQQNAANQQSRQDAIQRQQSSPKRAASVAPTSPATNGRTPGLSGRDIASKKTARKDLPTKDGDVKQRTSADGSVVTGVARGGKVTWVNQHGASWVLPTGADPSGFNMARQAKTQDKSALKETGTNERFITTKEGTRLRLVDYSGGVQVSAPFLKTRMLALGTSNEAIRQSDYFKATNSKTTSPLTLSGTRFEIKRQSGGAQNFVTQIQLANGSTRTVTAASVKQLKGKLEQALKGNTDALSASKPQTATWGQQVDYGGYKAMTEIFKLPAQGLAAIGFKGPKERLKDVTWDLENQGRQLGIREDSATVRTGGLLVNVPFAFAGGGAAAVTKLPAATKAVLTFGVMPAANRVGKDSFNGQLGVGTMTGVGTDIATGWITGKLGGSSVIRQAATSTVVQTGVKAASGNKVGVYDVFESAVLNTAGAAASNSSIGTTPRSPQRPDAAPSGSPMRNPKAPKGETTQSSSPPVSLRPPKQETTQQSEPPNLTPLPDRSEPNLSPLPNPSTVLAQPGTSVNSGLPSSAAAPETQTQTQGKVGGLRKRLGAVVEASATGFRAVASVPLQSAGKLPQFASNGLSTGTKNVTSGLDYGLKALEQSAPVQWLGNTPAVRATGNGLNRVADGYRATGRLALNNPLINSTVGRYQALSRQMRYFPEHMQAVRLLNQQKDHAKKGVGFYQDASRKLGTANNEAHSVAEQAQRQLARADDAAARGDTVTERQARHQAGIDIKRLQQLSGSAVRPLRDIDNRLGAQIKKGEKLLGQQEQLYNLRALQYQSALRADQRVQTPRVLEARQRLQEASLPFELPKQVAAKIAAYEELATQPDNSSNHVKAVEKAHAALKKTTADLSKLTMAGNDPALDVHLDRASGLREQLQLLRREQSDVRAAIRQLEHQQQALAQRAGGDPSAALQEALTGLGTANQFLGTRLASAQAKSVRLVDEPVFVGDRARSSRLAVDAIAAESDLSAKVADAGFLHSSAKDIFDGEGKGRIDVLSNKGKIEAAQQSVDATRAEVVQWRQQLTDIKASAQAILAARGTDKPAQQQALASQQWLHDDAARKLGQATKRLATAERWLDLEQRAAEPRSIQVRVRDLQAKINTSAAVLRSAQTQHAKQQGKLQGKLDALQERLQNTTDGAQREQLQAQVQKIDTRMQANTHALARVADIHSGTEALLPQAQGALGTARETAGMTPGKLARNALRGAMVASTMSKGLTATQLQLGLVAPDTAADLQPLLAQLNLPGSEKKIELKSIRPVPGVPGLHSIDTVQGKVYAWRVRGAFSDVMVVAQPTPQARGMLMAALLNGGTAGNASPSIQKGSEGLYMTIDSQKFALMGATFSSVFHPDPNSTALNWWETVKIELGSVGGTLRGNTKGTHPRTGAKQPMVELVQSNSIKAPLKFNNIKLPGMVPFIGNVLQVPDGVGLSVTVKNSLGVGQLSLVYDPELGVGQLADRTVSNELKFTGQLNDKLGFAGARYPGNQPYSFFGTAVRVEKNYYAINDPRNKGHWLMKATKGAETVFDRATGKPWLSEPLTKAIQSGLDSAKPVLNNGLKGLGQAGQEAEKRLRQVPPTLRQWLDDATTPPEPSQPPTRQQRKRLPDDKARS